MYYYAHSFSYIPDHETVHLFLVDMLANDKAGEIQDENV
jgi:hypothetical protein